MDHHVDLDLLADPEFAPHQLMNALFAKLHRALVAQGSTDIGVSFPGVEPKAPHLGHRLRLHGNQAALKALMTTSWLTGMRDHVEQGAVTAVPTDAKHRVVRRVQVQSNPERLRRRLMRRQGLDPQAALARIPDAAAEWLDLPYVTLRSTSTGQSFPLYIDHGPLLPSPLPGPFNAYGLSPTATVPWF
ncbi:type I-F CRISPR-associated endoribonuclease Cas6/Csy4 [Leptothrix ochracea]|uniref:type I-F CRISPR-associated endoribonuclease Cas6/Csy4 n=1 Tax=Leptothrix ochracea TaxID=735331 RepID=UPI0034E284AC